MAEKVIYLALVSVIPLFWLFVANPWEIPMWGGLLIVLFSLSFIFGFVKENSKLKNWFVTQTVSEKAQLFSGLFLIVVSGLSLVIFGKAISIGYKLSILGLLLVYLYYFVLRANDLEAIKEELKKINLKKVLPIVIVVGLIAVSLLVATSHIKPEGGDLKLVRPPILRTTVAELFLHWGIPITGISLGSLILMPNIFVVFIALTFLILSALSGEAMLVIYSLIILQVIRFFFYKKEIDWGTLISNSILLSGLGLILLPEIVFLDDPYGGENERMNTIFKVYTTAWFLLHFGALYLLRQSYKRLEKVT